MTTQPTAPPLADITPAGQFPAFPPRDDMQNILHLSEPSHYMALRRRLGFPLTTLVLGEVPVGWNIHTRREHLRVPDLIIAFDVDRERILAEAGYSIEEQGKPPDFVLEIASPNTARNDERGKRVDYARFGVPEYWRFDAFGGQYYANPLAGDRLVDGVYQPITIHKVDDDRYWGHSDVLNLDVCWEYQEIRWYDPVAQRYLLTFAAEREGRIVAEAQRDVAETERDAERDARTVAETERDRAETERDAERDARAAAEAQRIAAEAELARLRRQLGLEP